MLSTDIYAYIAERGKQWGIPPSPFSIEGQMLAKPRSHKGPKVDQATLMGRVGGLGNGGGKLQTAVQQGRGPARV